MPIITITADSFFSTCGSLESRRPVNWIHGRSYVTQLGDELCRVEFDLAEFGRDGPTSPLEFQGSLKLAGGIPLNVGLPNLILHLPDGRRVSIEITSLVQNERSEVYGVRGRLIRRDTGR